jgi:hypothetical protein
VWWSTPVIPGLWRQRQEDWEFQASLGERNPVSNKQTNKQNLPHITQLEEA